MEEAKKVKAGAKASLTKLCTKMQTALDAPSISHHAVKGLISEWDLREAKLEHAVENLTKLASDEEEAGAIMDAHMDYILESKEMYYQIQSLYSELIAVFANGDRGDYEDDERGSHMSSVSQRTRPIIPPDGAAEGSLTGRSNGGRGGGPDEGDAGSGVSHVSHPRSHTLSHSHIPTNPRTHPSAPIPRSASVTSFTTAPMTTQSYTGIGARLTKLELTTFSGNTGELYEFTSFKDEFCAHVHNNPNFCDSTKMSYLRHYLKGPAKEIIAGIPLSNDNYSLAWELINKRYGRPEMLKNMHTSCLMDLQGPSVTEGPAYVDQMYRLLTDIKRHVRGLEGLGLSTLR